MDDQNQDFSPIDFESGEQPDATATAPAPDMLSADEAPAKRGKKRGAGAWILGVVIALAILALAALCVNIFAPDFFNNIFNSTALTRGDETVLTIGDYEISAMEYNHYLYPVRVQYDAEDETYWKTHLEEGENIKNQALEMFRDNCAMLQWAKDAGLTLTDEDIAQAQAAIADVKASYATEAEYYAALEENCLTTELYQKIYEDSLLYNKLYEYVFTESELKDVSEADAQAYADANGYFGAKHILFATTGDETADAEKRALAEQVLAQLQGGADFDTLMMQYTEDPGITSYPDGYTFTEGQMVENFENAVKELEVGGLSGIVETDNGYHIILRIAPDTTTMTDAIIQERATAKIEEYRAAMGVKYSRGYDKITLDQTFWNYPASPDAQDDAA